MKKQKDELELLKDRLESLKAISAGYHLLHLNNGGASEFDKSINDISRNIIQTMGDIDPACFLWKLNKEEYYCVKYTGQKIYNFQFDLVTPYFDRKLYTLISLWNADIEDIVIEDKSSFVKSIFTRAEEIGGVTLSWA